MEGRMNLYSSSLGPQNSQFLGVMILTELETLSKKVLFPAVWL